MANLPQKIEPKSYDAFVALCLDGIDTNPPQDTHYNLLLRTSRKDRWRAADSKVYFFRTLANAIRAAERYGRYFPDAQIPLSAGGLYRDAAIAHWRRAIADLIRTPAPDQASVTEKRRYAKQAFLPISAEEIAKAIATDEAFLAAHPVRRSKGGTHVNS